MTVRIDPASPPSSPRSFFSDQKGSCGHAGFCGPKPDSICDHVDGNGVHQGYAYRCLLVKKHVPDRHFHDTRLVAREWYERSTGSPPQLAPSWEYDKANNLWRTHTNEALPTRSVIDVAGGPGGIAYWTAWGFGAKGERHFKDGTDKDFVKAKRAAERAIAGIRAKIAKSAKASKP